MELDQLKAHAYDCLAQIEAWQAKLKQANEGIADYNKTHPTVVDNIVHTDTP